MTTRAARRKEETERLKVEERQKLVDHAAGGLRLTPGAQARIGARMKAKQRSIVAPPESEKVRKEAMATFRAANSGVPADVQLGLEMLATLADQGNPFAARLWEFEVKRLGLWVERKLFLPT